MLDSSHESAISVNVITTVCFHHCCIDVSVKMPILTGNYSKLFIHNTNTCSFGMYKYSVILLLRFGLIYPILWELYTKI